MPTFPLISPVMTLPEFLKGSDIDDNARPLVEMFAASTDVYGALPFQGLSGPIYQGFRQAALPGSMAFRAINGAPTSGAGTITPFQESTYLVDHDIPIDAAVVRRGGDRRRAIEEKNGMAKLGELWIQNFVAGDNTTNPKVFNGLQKRSAKYNRNIDNAAGTSGGAAMSLYNLDNAIKNTRKPTHILMPFDFKPRMIQLARTQTLSGYVVQTFDEIGRPKLSYSGLPILFGYEKDFHPPMLQFNETAAGGGSAVTGSIYVCSFGEEGLLGIQLMPMEVRDMGLLQDGITFNTHISWDVGLVDAHPFCFTRLSGITNAAIVA